MRIECAYSELVELKSIIPHPSNRNRHSQKQVEVLAKIIAKNGQRSPIVISNLSRYVVKGHGRLEAIKLLGWEKAAVDFQDYNSELEELNDRIADNEIARYSEFDSYGFIEDLKGLEIDLKDVDYEEFGKINFNIDFGKANEGIVVGQLDPSKEWEGMPDFDQKDKTSFRHVIVHFKDEDAAKDFFERIEQKDTGNTRSLWFPPQENMETESKRYE